MSRIMKNQIQLLERLPALPTKPTTPSVAVQLQDFMSQIMKNQAQPQIVKNQTQLQA